MPDQNPTKIGLDVSDVQKAAIVYAKSLEAMNQAMRNQGKELIKLNKIQKESSEIFNKYSRLQSRITSSTNKLTAAKRANVSASQQQAAAVQHVATAQRNTANQHTKATQQMVRSNSDLILSAKGVERVLAILLIRRTFHLLITRMRESVTTIKDFHAALTEIQTIAQDNQAPLDAWADSIIRLSNAWDVDLLD
ncbi:MAG: hypothetical protein KAS32_22685, partial [Candidatus Peribacteraceae bacterium]|nr:hypothetical protein [Candidatus Peribacteraceae bacterium]